MDVGTFTAWGRPLVGREQDVRAIYALLQETEVRLLTLAGPGGVGKTRLAMQVASEVATTSSLFPDGCYFVSLATTREKEQVLTAVVQVLGLKESGQQAPLDMLKHLWREKRLLLVLDNFEQVVEAAPLISELLLHCLWLKVVITSRAVVHLYDEYVFQVVPLALPNLDCQFDTKTVAQFPAVELFLQRVKKVLPDFSLSRENAHTIAEICVRLDGLPLALELAAARMKLLTPQSLLTRLNRRLQLLSGVAQDVPERQQTLRRTLEWSYHLLSSREQLCFQWLAVFAGGVSLKALEAVWATLEEQAEDVLDLVTSLVDKNLLLVQPVKEGDEPRFLMLETIHEYALERLEHSEMHEQVRLAHALHYLAQAEELAPKLMRMEQVWYLKVLEQEYDNLQAAIGWLIASHQGEYALRLCVVLRIFWMQCHTREGFYWIRQALSCESETDIGIRAWALYVAGDLAYATGNSNLSPEYGQKSLKLFRTIGDKSGILILLNGFGHLALESGDGATLATMSAESLQLAREMGDRWRLAEALFLCGYSAYFEKDYSRARHLTEECLILCQEIGEPYSVLKATYTLAFFAHAQDDYTRVHALYEESFSLVRSALTSGHNPTIALYLIGSGAIATLEGHSLHTVHLWGAASTRHDIPYEVGSDLGIFEYLAMVLKTQLGSDQILKIVRNQLSDQTFVAAWDEGRRMSLDQLSRSFSEAVIAPVEAVPQSEKKLVSSSSTAISREKLTPRETEVLCLVAEGLTSSQIAQKLSITPLTVNSHVRSIYSKLGITTRSAATRYVLEQDL